MGLEDKMANMVIQDSGYLSPTNTGTRATAANMANSGSAMVLHGVEFKPSTTGNLDDSPRLGDYGTGTGTGEGATIHLVSVENMKFTIRGVLDMDVAGDRALVVPITQLPRTRWYKLLYFDSTTASEYNRQLLYHLSDDTFTAGEVTAFGLGAAYKHLHVMIENVQWSHMARDEPKMVYNMTGIVTNKETSTI